MMRLLMLILASAMAACGDDHNHAAGDGHGHGHGGSEDELEAVSVTRWTDKGELFVEYSPLIIGQGARFLAHLTELTSFKPVIDGRAVVTLTMANGTTEKAVASPPTRPGIFIPVVTPKNAGTCTLSLEVDSPRLRERFEIGKCKVFASKAEARAAAPKEQSGSSEISFLKEQQWPIEFGTAVATERDLQAGVNVNGEIEAVPGNSVRLGATAAGRVSFPASAPRLGMAVKKGQLLATVQPLAATTSSYGALLAQARTARAELNAAKLARDHVAPLVASKAVPRRRLDEAQSRVNIAQAQLEAAQLQMSAYNAVASGRGSRLGSFRVVSPIEGTLVSASVTAGESVAAGATLFTVVDLRRVWVTGRVYEMDLGKVEKSRAAWFRVEGRQEVFEITERAGHLVTLGHVVDRSTRTVPIVFEVANEDRTLRIGQFVELTVASGKPVRALAIPVTAILQEGTQSVAYVQTGGESFQRRVLRTGIRSRGWVEIRAGITKGEHVVVKGAYDVKLSASSGSAPAHGHAH